MCGLVTTIFQQALSPELIHDTVSTWDPQAAAILSDSTLADVSAQCEVFDLARVDQFTAAMSHTSLDEVIRHATELRKYRGLSREDLSLVMHDIPAREAVLNLMDKGQQAFMAPGFRPNGGLHFTQSLSYKQGRMACHRTLAKMMGEGQVIAVRWDAVSSHDRAQLHISKLLRAAKTGCPDGRICLNLSSSFKGSVSLNAGYDLVASDTRYPPPQLPTIHTISERCCQLRAAHPTIPLQGATADVKSAYCQVPLSVDAAKLRTTLIDVADTHGGIVKVLVIYVVSIFGDTRAGHVYNTFGAAINQLHNEGLRIPESDTYVDDGIIATPSTLTLSSLQRYCTVIEALYGQLGLSEDKCVLSDALTLVALGWRWDFDPLVWRVGPKPRGLAKLFLALFYSFPPEKTRSDNYSTFSRLAILQLAGLLNWYSAVLPAGSAFVHSLYRSAGYGDLHAKVRLSSLAKRDLEFWRAILFCGLCDPSRRLLSTPIEYMRVAARPRWVITTDASTSVGGGAWVCDLGPQDPDLQHWAWTNIHVSHLPAPSAQGCIRWSHDELMAILNWPGSINVLEYMVVIYYTILWSDRFSGSVVAVLCDNTAAVAWLNKNRTGVLAEAAYTAVQFASIILSYLSIRILATHLAGDLNTRADFLSRDVSLLEQDFPHPSCSNRARCLAGQWRTLLGQVLKQPSSVPDLLELKEGLLQL